MDTRLRSARRRSNNRKFSPWNSDKCACRLLHRPQLGMPCKLFVLMRATPGLTGSLSVCRCEHCCGGGTRCHLQGARADGSCHTGR